MQDLNDLALFVAVVRQNGFSAAARSLNLPKSKLSKHVARLEQQLDVRLLERSTRKLRVTEIGQAFFERCEAILAGVEEAEGVIAAARSAPSGLVRLASPLGFIPMLSDILPDFYRLYPNVRILITTTNRRIDLLEERIDIALRARNQLDTDNSLIVRKLGAGHLCLAASPDLLEKNGPITIDSLSTVRTLSMNEQKPVDKWTLHHRDGTVRDIVHTPIFGCSDFNLLARAAIDGIGVTILPEYMCERSFRTGQLVHVLPDWAPPPTIMHLVFTSRLGILPAVRALIDYLADALPNAVERCRERLPTYVSSVPESRALPLAPEHDTAGYRSARSE